MVVALAVNDDRIGRTIGQDWAVEATSGRGIFRYPGRLTADRNGSLSIALSGEVERIQRREFVRVDAFLDVTVRGVDEHVGGDTKTVDVSGSGIQIQDKWELPLGIDVRVELKLPEGPPLRALGRVVRVGQEARAEGHPDGRNRPRRRRSAHALHPRPRSSGAARRPRSMMAKKADKKKARRRRRRQGRDARLDLPAPAREGRHPPRPHARRVHRVHRRLRAQRHGRPGALRRRLARAGGRHRRQRRRLALRDHRLASHRPPRARAGRRAPAGAACACSASGWRSSRPSRPRNGRRPDGPDLPRDAPGPEHGSRRARRPAAPALARGARGGAPPARGEAPRGGRARTVSEKTAEEVASRSRRWDRLPRLRRQGVAFE